MRLPGRLCGERLVLRMSLSRGPAMIRKSINLLAALTIAFGALAASAAAPSTSRAQDPAMCVGGTEVCFCESGKCIATSGGCACR